MKTNKKNQKISRKQALKRLGKYAGLTAIGTLILLNPNKSAAQSGNPPNPGW